MTIDFAAGLLRDEAAGLFLAVGDFAAVVFFFAAPDLADGLLAVDFEDEVFLVEDFAFDDEVFAVDFPPDEALFAVDLPAEAFFAVDLPAEALELEAFLLLDFAAPVDLAAEDFAPPVVFFVDDFAPPVVFFVDDFAPPLDLAAVAFFAAGFLAVLELFAVDFFAVDLALGLAVVFFVVEAFFGAAFDFDFDAELFEAAFFGAAFFGVVFFFVAM